MRVLFTTHPADGHAMPMLSLSAALRGAGHDVLWATSASYVPRLEGFGERAAAAGVDWLESDGPSEPSDDPDDPDQWETMFARLFLRGALDQMAADLPAVIDEHGTDVIVREAVEWGGAVAAVQLGLPFATFDWAFRIHSASLRENPVDAAELDRMRALAGLPEEADADWFDGNLVITTLPDDYRGERPRPAGTQVVIRPNAVDRVGPEDTPDWVNEIDQAIYVTMGTVFTGTFPRLFEDVAHAAAGLGQDTVITHGASVVRDDLDLPTPDGRVRVFEYVPQDPVLARSAVAVTHGGTGTTLGCLARGVPQVVIPMGADQFAHADSVTRIGAGVKLDYDSVTRDEIAAAIQQILDDPSHAHAAQNMGEQLRALPGPEAGVAALEQLAAT